MKTSQENLRASFYLRKNVTHNGLCPVMGRIMSRRHVATIICIIASIVVETMTTMAGMNTVTGINISTSIHHCFGSKRTWSIHVKKIKAL